MLFDVFGWYNDFSEQRSFSFIQKSSLCFSCVSNDAPANKTPSVGPSGDPGDVLGSGFLWCYRTCNYWARSGDSEGIKPERHVKYTLTVFRSEKSVLNSGLGSALSLREGKEEGHAMNDSWGYSRLCSDGRSQLARRWVFVLCSLIWIVQIIPDTKNISKYNALVSLGLTALFWSW